MALVVLQLCSSHGHLGCSAHALMAAGARVKWDDDDFDPSRRAADGDGQVSNRERDTVVVERAWEGAMEARTRDGGAWWD